MVVCSMDNKSYWDAHFMVQRAIHTREEKREKRL